MKRILFASASLWLLFSSVLQAQNQGLDFYLYSSDKVRSVENSLQYRLFPYANFSMQITGQSSLEDRLSFNQKSKQSQLNLDFAYAQKSLLHEFSSDYQSVYDASDLEPSPYVNKTAILGYQLSSEPIDSLTLSLFSKGVFRREQDRYIASNQLVSRGYWLGGNVRYFMDYSVGQASITANTERKKLAWEAYDLAQMGASLNINSAVAVWDNSISYSNRSEDIYSLNSPTETYLSSYYKLDDNQKRQTLNLSSALQYYPDDTIQVLLSEDYSQKRTDYSSSEVRNNADFLNQAMARVIVLLSQKLTWDSSFNHGYAIKDYNFNLNTRHTENRQLGTKLAWEYANSDSLIAVMGVNLQVIEFPDDQHKWDNDLLTTSYKLGWKHYWRDRVRLGNWLGYSQREDVYLDSLLSANNKIVHSFNLNPDCIFLIGDRLAFQQAYLLRADYSNYIYDTDKANTFYRQLGYKLNFILDTFPFIARSQDPRWLKLPFRSSPDNALMIDLGYAYEENQYADQAGDVYELHTKNRRWTTSLAIRHDIHSFFWTVTPKYSWGTWKEYSLVFGGAWEFNNGSLIDFSLTPYGEQINALEWRSTFNLNLRF